MEEAARGAAEAPPAGGMGPDGERGVTQSTGGQRGPPRNHPDPSGALGEEGALREGLGSGGRSAGGGEGSRGKEPGKDGGGRPLLSPVAD